MGTVLDGDIFSHVSVALCGLIAEPGDSQASTAAANGARDLAHLWAMPIVQLDAHIANASTRMERLYDRFQASRFQRYRSAAINIMLVRDKACLVRQRREWGESFAAKGDTPQRWEVFG